MNVKRNTQIVLFAHLWYSIYLTYKLIIYFFRYIVNVETHAARCPFKGDKG